MYKRQVWHWPYSRGNIGIFNIGGGCGGGGGGDGDDMLLLLL